MTDEKKSYRMVITKQDIELIKSLRSEKNMIRRLKLYIKLLTRMKEDLYMMSHEFKSDELLRIGSELSGVRLDLMDEKNKVTNLRLVQSTDRGIV